MSRKPWWRDARGYERAETPFAHADATVSKTPPEHGHSRATKVEQAAVAARHEAEGSNAPSSQKSPELLDVELPWSPPRLRTKSRATRLKPCRLDFGEVQEMMEAYVESARLDASGDLSDHRSGADEKATKSHDHVQATADSSAPCFVKAIIDRVQVRFPTAVYKSHDKENLLLGVKLQRVYFQLPPNIPYPLSCCCEEKHERKDFSNFFALARWTEKTKTFTLSVHCSTCKDQNHILLEKGTSQSVSPLQNWPGPGDIEGDYIFKDGAILRVSNGNWLLIPTGSMEAIPCLQQQFCHRRNVRKRFKKDDVPMIKENKPILALDVDDGIASKTSKVNLEFLVNKDNTIPDAVLNLHDFDSHFIRSHMGTARRGLHKSDGSEIRNRIVNNLQ